MAEYAGQQLTTGKQAEAYAGFIGLHLKGIAGGKTYAQLGDVQSGLRAQIADAQKTNPEAVAGLQKQLTDVNAQRETVFKGETLRAVAYQLRVQRVRGQGRAGRPGRLRRVPPPRAVAPAMLWWCGP
jgi:hypothetical protein